MIHTPAEIRIGLARRFRGSTAVTYPEHAADDAMVIVRGELEARDAEITRQRAEIELLQSRLAALEDAP